MSNEKQLELPLEIREYNEEKTLTEILSERVKSGDKPYFVWYEDEKSKRAWVPSGNA